MPNPILPAWEYIPDGEPRVFGDRVYLYGSHDRAAQSDFCDYKLKVWSAPLDDLNNWVCHGHSFHTRDDRDHKSDTEGMTDRKLFAPDVIEKDGRYYLYAYIVGSKGVVGVSDKPEGPFKLLSQYKYDPEDAGDDSDNAPQEQRFFEASSPRKIGYTYYLIYSPCVGSRLAYATSDKPQGPFKYRGYIIDNGVDYPGGNDHGSVCNINGQWYIFYHRMTNNTIMSRRACVEKIEILPDGTIPTVEMTSLGFEDSLDPFKPYPADIACVLKGGCFITEKDIFTRSIVNITEGNVIGYKYFDFGEDFSSKTMKIALKVRGMGTVAKVAVYADDYENSEPVGYVDIGTGDGVYTGVIKSLTGRHSIYFVPTAFSDELADWIADYFKNKPLFELEEFVFMK